VDLPFLVLLTVIEWLPVFALSPHCQTTSCVSEVGRFRYRDFVFDSASIQKDTLTYAVAVKNWVGVTHDLEMTVFTSADDCPAAGQRPCVVLAHGGTFKSGSRESGLLQRIATGLARRGVVAATIDYRTWWVVNGEVQEQVTHNFSRVVEKCSPPGQFNCLQGFDVDCAGEATSLLHAIHRAAQDGRAAIRFLKTHHAQLAIDTGTVFMGGYSAGAVIALMTAYYDASEVSPAIRDSLGPLDPHGWTGMPSAKVAGVISISGGILHAEWLHRDENGRLEAEPALFFHGTCDNTVPYYFRRFHGNMQCLQYPHVTGPMKLAETIKLGDLPVCYELHTGCGFGHELHHSCQEENPHPSLLAEVVDYITATAARFCYRQLCGIPCPQVRHHYFCKPCYCQDCRPSYYNFREPACETLCRSRYDPRNVSALSVCSGSNEWTPQLRQPTEDSSHTSLSNLLINPNPNNGLAQYYFHSHLSESIDLTIFNRLGQQVLHHQHPGISGLNCGRLDLRAFPPGVYLARLCTASGVALSCRIVVLKGE